MSFGAFQEKGPALRRPGLSASGERLCYADSTGRPASTQSSMPSTYLRTSV